MEAKEFFGGLNDFFAKFWVWLKFGLGLWAGFWILGIGFGFGLMGHGFGL